MTHGSAECHSEPTEFNMQEFEEGSGAGRASWAQDQRASAGEM